MHTCLAINGQYLDSTNASTTIPYYVFSAVTQNINVGAGGCCLNLSS